MSKIFEGDNICGSSGDSEEFFTWRSSLIGPQGTVILQRP